MNLFDKLSTGISQSVNTIIDKNRQYAQINRINAVIRNEKEVLDRAYIALGKQYCKVLQGNAEETTDVSQLCAVIEASKLRLKKAQARYDYIIKYGMPVKKENQPVVKITADEDVQPDINSFDEAEDEEDGDITIACVDSPAETEKEISVETAESGSSDIASISSATIQVEDTTTKSDTCEKVSKTEEASVSEDEDQKEKISKKASDSVNELKKKRSYSKKKTIESADSEAANDSDATPIV